MRKDISVSPERQKSSASAIDFWFDFGRARHSRKMAALASSCFISSPQPQLKQTADGINPSFSVLSIWVRRV